MARIGDRHPPFAVGYPTAQELATCLNDTMPVAEIANRYGQTESAILALIHREKVSLVRYLTPVGRRYLASLIRDLDASLER